MKTKNKKRKVTASNHKITKSANNDTKQPHSKKKEQIIRAAIIGAAKRVDLTTAWDILSQTEDESDDFFKKLVDAERDALKKRFI